MWLLAFADWCYGRFTHRAPEGDTQHLPKGKEQIHSFLQAAKGAARTIGLPELPDEIVEVADGADSILAILCSRPKAEWIPPKVVRIADIYYRLESTAEGKRPRPFVYRLRRLAAGVPGRNVLLYEPPVVRNPVKPS
jgi:hypothetical protein